MIEEQKSSGQYVTEENPESGTVGADGTDDVEIPETEEGGES